MQQYIKLSLKIFLCLAITLILLVFGVISLVNPSQFKTVIEHTVSANTGHRFSIQGPIQWKWYPLLSLELDNVTLDNAAPFNKNHLLSAKTVQTEVQLLPLFLGKVFLNLKMQGVNLILERNNEGLANWEAIQNTNLKLESPQDKNSEPTESFQAETKNPSPIENVKTTNFNSSNVLLNAIQIESGQIIYHDDAKNKHYMLDHLYLTADNLLNGFLGVDNPFQMRFHLENLNNHSMGNFALIGDWALSPNKKEIQLQNLKFEHEFPDGKKTKAEGAVKIQNLSHAAHVEGCFKSPALNLRQWWQGDLTSGEGQVKALAGPELPSTADVSTTFVYENNLLDLQYRLDTPQKGSIDGNLNLSLKPSDSRFPEFSGDFKGTQLNLNTFTVDDFSGSISMQQNLLTVDFETLQIFNSQQKANLKVDLKEDEPKFYLTQTGSPFEVNQLFKAFGKPPTVEGSAILSTDIRVKGKDKDAWLQNLSGTLNLQITDGKLYGFDLIHLLKSSENSVYTLVTAFTKKQSIDLESLALSEQVLVQQDGSTDKVTPFDSLLITGTLQNGVLNNPEIVIDHKEYSVQGNGKLNLSSSEIQYQASALLKSNPFPNNDKLAQYLYATPIPVLLKGSLEKPELKPDLKTYSNNAILYAEKNVIQHLLDNTLNRLINK